MLRRYVAIVTVLLIVVISVLPMQSTSHVGYGGLGRGVVIEVLLSRSVVSSDLELVSKLGGKVIYVLNEINGLAVYISRDRVGDLISGLKDVRAFGEASEVRVLSEVLPSTCGVHNARLTWNLDIINVPTVHEVLNISGEGVYVAVLDTGLEPQWRDYFNEENIDSEHAAAFLGALATAYWATGEVRNRNAWEADTNGHGMHVVSVILGFKVYNLYVVDGVAPGAKVIPVKVISNSGVGFSADVAAGIIYITELFRAENLSGGNVLKPYGIVNPVIISLSLGSSQPSLLIKEAIDYAIESGVFVVAAAGNEGDAGMTYPGAYPEVISVGAAGWVGQWGVIGWWVNSDVPEDLEGQVYVPNFSSRALEGQYLDVIAPGTYVVGPYTPYGAAHPPPQSNGIPGQYYYLSGTSVATPHVSGVLALMLQADMLDGSIDLTQELAECILNETAFKVGPGSATVLSPEGTVVTHVWGANAVGSGLILADKAVNYVLEHLVNSSTS